MSIKNRQERYPIANPTTHIAIITYYYSHIRKWLLTHHPDKLSTEIRNYRKTSINTIIKEYGSLLLNREHESSVSILMFVMLCYVFTSAIDQPDSDSDSSKSILMLKFSVRYSN